MWTACSAGWPVLKLASSGRLLTAIGHCIFYPMCMTEGTVQTTRAGKNAGKGSLSRYCVDKPFDRVFIHLLPQVPQGSQVLT